VRVINPDEMQTTFDTVFNISKLSTVLTSLILCCQSLPFSPESCVVEEGKDYGARSGADTIDTWTGVTQENCASIAASIVKQNQWGSQETLYWSYQESKNKCSIKNVNTRTVDSRFVSGSSECGTTIPGRNLVFLSTHHRTKPEKGRVKSREICNPRIQL
jgi:hypothetical protein